MCSIYVCCSPICPQTDVSARALQKGSAELLVLAVLDGPPRHGYEIAQLIELFGLSATNGCVLASTAAALAAASCIACLIPASRAAGIDPVSSLRADSGVNGLLGALAPRAEVDPVAAR